MGKEDNVMADAMMMRKRAAMKKQMAQGNKKPSMTEMPKKDAYMSPMKRREMEAGL